MRMTSLMAPSDLSHLEEWTMRQCWWWECVFTFMISPETVSQVCCDSRRLLLVWMQGPGQTSTVLLFACQLWPAARHSPPPTPEPPETPETQDLLLQDNRHKKVTLAKCNLLYGHFFDTSVCDPYPYDISATACSVYRGLRFFAIFLQFWQVPLYKYLRNMEPL